METQMISPDGPYRRRLLASKLEKLERSTYRRYLMEGAVDPFASMVIAAARSLGIKYSPDQPRIPAGSPEGGRWTGSAGNGGGGFFQRVANIIIHVCTPFGIRRDTDAYGNKSYLARYECSGGEIITRSGPGDPPGLILDPFR
jgi:hypothetical protein